MLTVEPLFGLCNRMQALDSVLSLADELDRPVTLIWNVNRELHCRFEDLFVVPPAIAELRQPRRRLKPSSGPSTIIGTRNSRPGENPHISGSGRWSNLALGALRRLNDSLLRHRRYDCVLYDADIARLMEAPVDREAFRAFSTVYIRTYKHFYKRPPAFSRLRPVPALEQAVAAQVAAFPEDVVGVHVRRTDHWRGAASTTDRFVSLMRDEVARSPGVRFFLATDDTREEAVLTREFPNRVLIRPKQTLNRNDPMGIQDALIDLYCLSHTRKVLGTIRSSFSRTAALLGNREFVKVR